MNYKDLYNKIYTDRRYCKKIQFSDQKKVRKWNKIKLIFNYLEKQIKLINGENNKKSYLVASLI
jgi:hypothetical protein